MQSMRQRKTTKTAPLREIMDFRSLRWQFPILRRAFVPWRRPGDTLMLPGLPFNVATSEVTNGVSPYSRCRIHRAAFDSIDLIVLYHAHATSCCGMAMHDTVLRCGVHAAALASRFFCMLLRGLFFSFDAVHVWSMFVSMDVSGQDVTYGWKYKGVCMVVPKFFRWVTFPRIFTTAKVLMTVVDPFISIIACLLCLHSRNFCLIPSHLLVDHLFLNVQEFPTSKELVWGALVYVVNWWPCRVSIGS